MRLVSQLVWKDILPVFKIEGEKIYIISLELYLDNAIFLFSAFHPFSLVI
jgi:hypothetical protein